MMQRYADSETGSLEVWYCFLKLALGCVVMFVMRKYLRLTSTKGDEI